MIETISNILLMLAVSIFALPVSFVLFTVGCVGIKESVKKVDFTGGLIAIFLIASSILILSVALKLNLYIWGT